MEILELKKKKIEATERQILAAGLRSRLERERKEPEHWRTDGGNLYLHGRQKINEKGVLELTEPWVFHVVRILGVGVDSLYPLWEKRLSRSERK